MAKWIEFVEVPARTDRPRITKRWDVRTTQGCPEIIGRITWSRGWRRYVLQPGDFSEWEQDCLRDVAEFLEAQSRERKAEREGGPRA